MASYARDARFVFAANVASLLAGLAVQAMLAYWLLPAGRGEYAAATLYATLLILALALGQEMANVYYIGSQQLSVAQAFTQSLAMALATSTVACVVGYLLPLAFPARFAVAPIAYFQLCLLHIPLAIVRMYLSHIFVGAGAMGQYTLLSALPATLNAVGLLVGFWTQLTVVIAIWVFIASEAVVVCLTVWILVRRHAARLTPLEPRGLARSLGYGVRFYVGKLCSMANVQIGNIILAGVVKDAAAVGMFAAGSSIFSRLWLLAESLQMALLPRTVSDPAGRARTVAQLVRLCLAVCSVATLLLFLLSKPIIRVVLSDDFLPVLVPMWILLPGILARVVAKILPAYFAGIDRPQVTSLAMGLAVAVNLGLMWLLLPLWGLAGVALSMTIAYAVESLVMAIAFVRFSGLPIGQLVGFSRADAAVLIAVVRGLSNRLRRAAPGAAGST
jgi:O-antigen/teichoic acid export membrane protein